MRAASWSTLGLIGSSTRQNSMWKSMTVYRKNQDDVRQLKRGRRFTTFDQLCSCDSLSTHRLQEINLKATVLLLGRSGF